MRKFRIVSTYAKDDLRFSFDAYDVTLYDENDEVIVSGDWYHDKIDEQIEGFFACLDYLGIAYEKSEEKRNHPDY